MCGPALDASPSLAVRNRGSEKLPLRARKGQICIPIYWPLMSVEGATRIEAASSHCRWCQILMIPDRSPARLGKEGNHAWLYLGGGGARTSENKTSLPLGAFGGTTGQNKTPTNYGDRAVLKSSLWRWVSDLIWCIVWREKGTWFLIEASAGLIIFSLFSNRCCRFV